jgi:ABC-type transporter Mla subunit MlaD
MLVFGALGLAAVALVYAITSAGGSSGYTVVAEFHDVDGLRQGATVKVAGVPAGIVTKLVVTRHDTALATLTLDPGAAPIGSGASVQVRPTDLLGEHYAQLTVGDLSHPQPSGSFIPDSRTSVPVELDQVLNMLDVNVRTRLRILIDEAGIALAGRGADFNTLLTDLPPNLGQATAMLEQVSSENATLQNLIDEGDRITTAVNGRRVAMGNLITTAEEALHSVALRQSQLGSTLQNAPGALGQLQATLARLGSASQAIIPAANSLQATAPALTATLNQLPSFARASDPTLVTARQVAPALERLGRDAQAPLRSLQPTAGDLHTIADSAAPILSFEDQRAMRDTLWFVENWALGLKGRDNLGHFIGGDLQIDPSIITSVVSSLVNNGAAGKVRPRPGAAQQLAAPVPAPTSAPPQAGGSGAPGAGSGAAGGVAGVLNTTTSQLSNALGAIGGAVNGIIGGLVGGAGTSTGQGTQGAQSPGASSSSSGSLLGNARRLLDYLLRR